MSVSLLCSLSPFDFLFPSLATSSECVLSKITVITITSTPHHNLNNRNRTGGRDWLYCKYHRCCCCCVCFPFNTTHSLWSVLTHSVVVNKARWRFKYTKQRHKYCHERSKNKVKAEEEEERDTNSKNKVEELELVQLPLQTDIGKQKIIKFSIISSREFFRPGENINRTKSDFNPVLTPSYPSSKYYHGSDRKCCECNETWEWVSQTMPRMLPWRANCNVTLICSETDVAKIRRKLKRPRTRCERKRTGCVVTSWPDPGNGSVPRTWYSNPSGN